MSAADLITLTIPEYGSAYAIIEDELTQIPMNADGTLVDLDGSCSVDFDNIPTDEVANLQVVQALLVTANMAFRMEEPS